MVSLAKCCDTVCFGSLAQRSSVSRQTIHNFLQATRIDCLRIFDVNLRQDFYSREVVERSLEFASVLKLNEDELPTVLQLLDAPSGSHQENIRWLSRTYSLSHVALTRGAAGSMLYADNVFDERESPQVEVIDTVGAGDAFTAALAVGLLNEEPLPEFIGTRLCWPQVYAVNAVRCR